MIVISYLYQWLGDVEVLNRYLPNAEAAMAWVDASGDRDGDGFQEYRTRSSHGYYNQGWKDAGDGILEADGSLSELPIGRASCRATPTTRSCGWVTSTTLGRLDDAERFGGRRATSMSGSTTTSVGERGDVLPRTQWAQAADRSVASNRVIAWRVASYRPIAPGASWSG